MDCFRPHSSCRCSSYLLPLSRCCLRWPCFVTIALRLDYVFGFILLFFSYTFYRYIVSILPLPSQSQSRSPHPLPPPAPLGFQGIAYSRVCRLLAGVFAGK